MHEPIRLGVTKLSQDEKWPDYSGLSLQVLYTISPQEGTHVATSIQVMKIDVNFYPCSNSPVSGMLGIAMPIA